MRHVGYAVGERGAGEAFFNCISLNECEQTFTSRLRTTKEFFTIPKMFINNVFSNTKDSIISKFYLYLDPTNVKGFYQYQRMFCNARNVSYISGELLNKNLAKCPYNAHRQGVVLAFDNYL